MILLRLQNPSAKAQPAEAENGRSPARRLPAPFHRLFRRSLPAGAAIAAALALISTPLAAQEKLSATISADASIFTISQNNRIAFAVPHLKRMKKIMIERDDISIADLDGREKTIVEPDKFMPVPPPTSYVVRTLALSPDGRRIAATMVVFTATKPEDDDEDSDDKSQKKHKNQIPYSMPSSGLQAIALFDDDGHEIRVAGSKTRFIEQGSDGAWLADDQTVVYLGGIGPYKIVRVRPTDGKTTILFEGHTFDSVVWDAPRNQAFAIGRSLSLSGRNELVQLDLLHETVREIARVPVFQGQLTVSPSGQEVGYYVDGDTIEVLNVANPSDPIRVRTGPGTFQFGHDDNRILFKRGLIGDAGDLIWVGLHDDSWVPILHDLEFHAFKLAPDGNAVVVMDPGKGILKVYR